MRSRSTAGILLFVALAGCGGSPPEPGSVDQTAPPSAADETTGASEGASAPDGAVEGSYPESAIPESVDLVGAAPAVIDDTSGYYRLETDVGGTAGCLEGNRRADDSVLKGAAFVDDCQDVTGQLWKLVPREKTGYYHLQTLFLEDQNKCFEGNAMSPEAELDGASYLGDCGEATGQDWKFMDAGGGAYRLQTAFLEAENKCLEGNRLGATALLGGAAHMSDCREVPGQLWKLVPVADTSTAVARALVDAQGGAEGAAYALIEDTSVYYRLQTDAGGASKCLDGNQVAEGAPVGGAAFTGACQDAAGQLWRLNPMPEPGQYHLQTQSLEEQLKCFDSNQPSSEEDGERFMGAAAMNDCAPDDAQVWMFVDAGDGAYRVQTKSLEGQNRCLNGNDVTNTSVMNGAAYMDVCQAVDGQLWKLVPTDSQVPAAVFGVPSP